MADNEWLRYGEEQYGFYGSKGTQVLLPDDTTWDGVDWWPKGYLPEGETIADMTGIEFGEVFETDGRGRFRRTGEWTSADVTLEPGQIRDLDGALPEGWHATTGFSGQYGYPGPIMHDSEQVGGDMARALFGGGEPREYVRAYCVWLPEDEDGDMECEGWVILTRQA